MLSVQGSSLLVINSLIPVAFDVEKSYRQSMSIYSDGFCKASVAR
jgi:hypothetical protein